MKLLEEMLGDVRRFNEEICRVTVPEEPCELSEKRLGDRSKHLGEEMAELISARTWEDQADALVDLIYVALGGLVEMGITPGSAFNEVQRANMAKVHGVKPSRPDNKHDAVKPEGWVGPDLRAALPLSILRAMSPAIVEATVLSARKGKDYNASVGRGEYFPLGSASYFQMVHIKYMRLKNLTLQGGTPNFESLRDTLLDLINYSAYWAESINKEGS